MISCVKNNIYCVLFIIVFLAVIGSEYKLGNKYVDSDMAAEMIMAQQLNDEGTLLSEKWYYSTELRVICEPTLFKITLKVFPNNWHAARVLAKAIVLLLLAIFFMYLSKLLGFKKEAFLGCTALICPFGFWHMFHAIFGPIYLTYMVYCTIIMALIIHINNIEKRSYMLWVSLFVISFLAGLPGIRMALILIPLLVASCILLIKRVLAERKITISTWEGKLFFTNLLTLVAFFVGNLLNVKYLTPKYELTDLNKTWSEFSITEILNKWSDFFELFGYPYTHYFPEIKVMTKQGIILGGGGLLLAGLVLFSIYRIGKNINGVSIEETFIYYTVLSILVIDGVVFSFMGGIGGANGSYWLPCIPLVVLLVMIEIRNECSAIKKVKYIFIAALMVVVFTVSIENVKLYTNSFIAHPEGIDECVEWLEDNNYKSGYATFWNSNIVTEMTNGDIEMWTVEDLQSLEIFRWLQKKSHVVDVPEGDVFILTKADEYDVLLQKNANIDEKCVYHNDFGFRIFSFKDIRELYEYLGKPIDNEY